MATVQQKVKKAKNAKPAGKIRMPDFDIIVTALSTILFLFMAFTNQWVFRHDIELYFALLSAIIFIVVCLKRENRSFPGGHTTPMFLVLLAHSALYFAGMFYTVFPKFALQQFFLNIGGLFIFASAYMEFSRNEKNVGKLISALSISIAAVSFASIELATSRKLIGLFHVFANLISATVPSDYGGFETNTRVLSVMGNPNTFAPVASIGMLFAVWLSGRSGSRSKRSAFYMGIAVITGTAFILSFSMGTILTLVPSIAAFMFFSKKGQRIQSVIPVFYCLVFSAIGAAAVFTLLNSGLLAPAAVLLIAALSGALYIFIKPIEIKSVGSRKARIAVYAACAAILVIAASAALLLRGAYGLAAGQGIRRAIYLDEGTYTVEFNIDGVQSPEGTGPSVTAEISSMSLTQAALKEQTLLASGTVAGGEPIEFTVPEGARAVFFRITANSDLTLSKALVKSGGETVKEIPLKYRLVPEFIVNRMQAIWVNDNAIQRFIFFRDGIRIGLTSPIIGLGGGAYEGKIFGAADYYYETVHTHNHYIQCFIDGGIIGFALFTALAVLSFICLFKSGRLKEHQDMHPFIAGAVVMIFFHSLIEVDFSAPAFKALASVVLAVLAVYYEKRINVSKVPKFAASSAIWLSAAVTLLLSLGRIKAVNGVINNPTLESIEAGVNLDPFNRDDYMVSYLLSTMSNTNSALITSRANSYIERLESRPMSHDTAYLLSQYYFLKSKPNYEKGIKLAEYFIREKKVNPNAWDNIFTLYMSANLNSSPEGKELIAESVLRLSNYLDELNSELPKEIRPEWITEILLWAGLHKEDPYSISTFDSRVSCDRNGDGISDLIAGQSESELLWRMKLPKIGKYMYVIKVHQSADMPPRVYIDGAEIPGSYNELIDCYLYLLVPNAERHIVEISANPSHDPYFTIESVAAAG